MTSPPAHPKREPGLFGVARGCLLNTTRGASRRAALAVKLAEVGCAEAASVTSSADDVVGLVDLATAWRSLAAVESEALSLVVFEELSSAESGGGPGHHSDCIPTAPVPGSEGTAKTSRTNGHHRCTSACTQSGDDRMNQDQIERSLRRLDAAGDMSGQDQQRGEQLLERILGTPFDEQQPGTRRPRHSTRRILAVAAAVSVGTAALLLIQGQGGSSSAYASWTAAPTAVSPHDLAVVTGACRPHLAQYIQDNADAMQQEGMSGRIDAQTVAVGVAERRGDLVAVVFNQSNPALDAPCVARNPPESGNVSDVQMSFGWSNGPAETARGTQLFRAGCIAVRRRAVVVRVRICRS